MEDSLRQQLENDDYVPGTEHILADEERLIATYGEVKRHNNVILIPQPSNSKRDPLNWSVWQKSWQFALLMLITGLTAATSNDAGAAQNQMNADLGISWGSMNTAAGVLFIGIGYFTLLLSPTAFLYGRKIGYIVCIVLGLFGSLWFARIQNTQDSIWNQLLVGASEACAEAQVQLSLSDMFFHHQLGGVLGTYILATSAGIFLGPLVAGYVSGDISWRWVGWVGVIASGVTLFLIIFTMSETSYDRKNQTMMVSPSASSSTDATAHDNLNDLNDEKKTDNDCQEMGTTFSASSTPPIWKRYLTSVQIITPAPNLKGWGFKQYFNRLWLTLRVFLFPAVLYSGLQWGSQDAWLTFYMTTQDEHWSSDPYNYSDAAVAIMNVPTLIGAFIGCVYGGIYSDHFVMAMAKRNGGIKEPEMRLWLMMLTAIISPLGMFLFGIGTAKEWPWPVPYVGLGFIGFGWGCAGDLSMAYLMDAYPAMVLEGMVGVSVINNTVGCIFTFVCSLWLDSQGSLRTYVAIGVLDFFFMMLTLPMIYYGKTCRVKTKSLYYNFLQARDGM